MRRALRKKAKKKEKKEYPLKLAEEIKIMLAKLAEEGHSAEMGGRYDEAVQLWQEALSFIPKPQQAYLETMWFASAIGDVYILKKIYPKALEYIEKAMHNWSGAGYEDPFLLRSMGEIYYEMGEEGHAVEYLKKAYWLEGEEIFEPDGYGKIDHSKYFAFLKTQMAFDEVL